MSAGVSLTFDVDGPAGLACRPVAGRWEGRLSSVSEAQFGLTRGLPRVLDVLAEFGVAATFYVPGATALANPAAIREIAGAGHELAHHGHDHLPSHTLDAAGQRDELVRGIAALREVAGVAPAGYRSPAWELTPVTLELLPEHDFAHDSSLMGDDRPYRLGGLVELPVHWSLDDVPYFPRDAAGDPRVALHVWRTEHAAARAEHRHLTYTFHPEVIGRAHRIDVLRALLTEITEAATPVLRHDEAARATPRRSAPLP